MKIICVFLTGNTWSAHVAEGGADGAYEFFCISRAGIEAKNAGVFFGSLLRLRHFKTTVCSESIM